MSGLDSLLLPFSVMIIVWFLIKPANAKDSLAIVARIVVWSAALNGIVASIQSQVEISYLLRPFWAAESGLGTVAENAAQGHRYSGIFNQPAEAGVFYSIAFVLAVWLYRNRQVLLYPAIVLITAGGALAITKNFLYVDLPIGLIYLLTRYRLIGKIATISTLCAVFIGSIFFGNLGAWGGFERLWDVMGELFSFGAGDRVKTLTAGRWNEEAGLMEIMRTVVETRPISGYGFSGLQVAYDSLWTETLVQSGLIGVFLVVCIFVMLLFCALHMRDKQMQPLAFAILAVMVGASAGLPTITSNRVATILWLIISLLVLSGAHSKSLASRGMFAHLTQDVKGNTIKPF